MSRLFITSREINFISDITKELVKDVVGQKVYLYPISILKTKTHEVYLESSEKIFDNPIELDALVDSPQNESKTDRFGPEDDYKLEVYLQYRDLVDKEIEINIGDFFSFGENFYEITQQNIYKTIYGQVEHKDGIKLVATKARESQFKEKLFGPTDISYSDTDAVQKTFVQQRGQSHNRLGETNDIRALQENEVLEAPLTGPKEVSPAGSNITDDSSFYDE